MLKANTALTAAASLMVDNYKETMSGLKNAAELTLNAHVDNFMTELRETYPQYEFDFWGDHIKVYYPPVAEYRQMKRVNDLVMTVTRFTELDSDQRTVGITASMVAFLNELGEIDFAMDGVDFELTHNHTPRYVGL